MFFAEPARSFANLRRALRPSGRLAFACWREPRENPFFMAPLQAAYKHVPKLPQPGPEDPGPFAFASEARVRRSSARPDFPGSGWNHAISRSISRSGAAWMPRSMARWKSVRPPARSADQPPDVVAAATRSIREALAAFPSGQSVALPASIWIVTAQVS